MEENQTNQVPSTQGDNQTPNSPENNQSPQKHTGLIIAGIIVIAIIAVFAFSNKNANSPAETNNSQTSEIPLPPIDNIAIEDIQTFELSGQNFSFTPNQLTVKKGQTVKVIFKNEQGFHDFVIDEFNAATEQIQEGKTTEVTFIADQAGNFEFYCAVGNHRAQGMVGTLTVTE